MAMKQDVKLLFRCVRSIAVALTILMVAACGLGSGGGKRVEKNTMTQRQATERVEQIIRDTIAMLDPVPHLERQEAMSQPRSCVDPTDGGSPDRTVISHTYLLRGLPDDHNGTVAKRIKAYWDSKGVRFSNADGLASNEPDITGYTRQDEFLVSLSTNAQKVLMLTVTSPCIWPNGTPGPAAS
jgi:hypothetical protein